MKKLSWIVLFSIGCGSSGDMGVADFYVGETWKNNSDVAVGSTFRVSATQGFWRDRLTLKGCSEELLQINGEIATTVGEGTCTIEAYDDEESLVDRFHVNILQPTNIRIFDDNDPNEYWSNGIPEQFGIIERTSSAFSFEVQGKENTILQHVSLFSIQIENSWRSSVDLDGDTISIHGHQQGKSSFSISDGNNINKQYEVITMNDDNIQSIVFRLSQPQDWIPRYGEAQQINHWGSWVYMHVDIRSWENIPILLPADSVRLVGEENYIETGAFGFWVNRDTTESKEFELKIGNRTAFAYVD